VSGYAGIRIYKTDSGAKRIQGYFISVEEDEHRGKYLLKLLSTYSCERTKRKIQSRRL